MSRCALLRRLAEAERVVQMSAPAGSGKTVLMRSWIAEAGLAARAAWVAVDSEVRDPQRFWCSVVGALRQTVPGAALVRALMVAPDLDGWAITERLLTDLAPLADRIWLVIDDVHELGPDALRQLELLVLRAPPDLRLVLATRHDLRLGLHRLRLEGELTEIRELDLRFTVAEARELLTAAGVQLPDAALVSLHERTEGWAAGLRLAALLLAGHDDPARFAARFSGSERTVAEYLLAEVLDQQPEQIRRLLLRTSILDRVNGELADLLTGDTGGERVLQDLEQANAFVISLNGSRSWFRYHQMFAGLLQLELRRAASGEVAALHRTAAHWLAEHEYPVEAIRHAQSAGDWGLAAGLLTDHWPGLHLDGRAATTHELLTGFPASVRAADAGLAAVAAADELAYGSLQAAEWYQGLAERGTASVPDARRAQAQLLLGIVRLLVVRQRGDLPTVAEEARRMESMAEAPDAALRSLSQDLHALALISLGITEVWTGQFQEAERHLEQGIALAHRIGRPYLEFTGLAHLAAVEMFDSYARAAERSRQAIDLAERHGWASDPAAGTAYMALGTILTWQGRLDEAEPWVQRAEHTHTAQAQPATGHVIRYLRGLLELARGRDVDALAAFQAAEPLARRLAASHYTVPRARALLVQVLVRLGDTEGAERALARLRDHGETCIATAALRLAQDDPHAAVTALAPVLDGAPPVLPWIGLAHAFLLDAIAQDALGDPAAAGRALEHALDLAEPDGALALFLLHPAAGLLERHAGHGTAHRALIAQILDLLSGTTRSARPPGGQPGWARSRTLDEPLTESETRVLRYLPTHLTGSEIAKELFLSVNTVSTHMRHLYAKLGVHNRHGAVDRARALGLLAPSARRA